MTLEDRLLEIEAQTAEIHARLADPAVATDPASLKRYG